MSNSSSEAASAAPASIDRLKPNAIGLAGVVFMAIATAAPITAMTSNVPIMVGFGTGIGAPGAFLTATLILTIFSIGYIAMSRRITAAGAFYGFISHGLGRVIGMGSGLLATMAYIVFEATLVAIFAVFAGETFGDQLGLDLPWQVYAFVMIAVVATLAFFEINLTAKFLAVVLATEIAILSAMSLGVLFAGGGPDGIPLAPINPVEGFNGPAVGLGLFFAFWCWVGFESTAMYGEESRNPKRNIPIATIVVVVGVGIFYALVSWMAISGVGLGQSVAVTAGDDPFELFFSPTREFVGAWAVTLFQWLILTGSLACGLAFHNCASRYLYAFGREGFISRRLGRTHPKHRSPYVASLVQTGLTIAITTSFWISGLDPFVGQYALMAVLGTFAILVVQTLCSFSVIAYFLRQPASERNWLTTFLAPMVGGVAMIGVVLLLITNLDTAAGEASSTLFFDLIPWIIMGIFIAGCAVALYLKRYRPERYRVIGRIVFRDATEDPGFSGDLEPVTADPTGLQSAVDQRQKVGVD